MTQRPAEGAAPRQPTTARADAPPPDAVAFIRFCHRRRQAGWPELYDEMCSVAARREFKGWGHDQLADHGVAFSLQEMPRLAGWVRAVIAAAESDERTGLHRGAGTPRTQPSVVGV